MIAGTVSEKDVCLLVKFCAWSYTKYYTYKVLFEGFGDRKPNYGHIAPVTLGDLARALNDQLILEACKLTDPMNDGRGNENLSIQFFVKCADIMGHDREVDELRQLSNRLEAFGKKLRSARDKI
jgi:hypothetical protein